MKKSTKGTKANKTTTAEQARHRQASQKLQRFAKRMNRLTEKYGRFGAPVADALAAAKTAFEAAVKHLDGLPDDFEQASRVKAADAKAAPVSGKGARAVAPAAQPTKKSAK